MLLKIIKTNNTSRDFIIYQHSYPLFPTYSVKNPGGFGSVIWFSFGTPFLEGLWWLLCSDVQSQTHQ